MGDPVELKAGTHVELLNAKVTGGVKVKDGKIILLGVVAEFGDFHGAMEDLETIGDKDFAATFIIEGRVVREVIPDKVVDPKNSVPKGQMTLPLADATDDPSLGHGEDVTPSA